MPSVAAIDAALTAALATKQSIAHALSANLRCQAELREDMRALCQQAGECDDVIDELLAKRLTA